VGTKDCAVVKKRLGVYANVASFYELRRLEAVVGE
jgi:hypothetical protein